MSQEGFRVVLSSRDSANVRRAMKSGDRLRWRERLWNGMPLLLCIAIGLQLVVVGLLLTRTIDSFCACSGSASSHSNSSP